MSIQDIYTTLTTAKFDVHYGDAPEGTSCPYVVFTDVDHPNSAADNRVWVKTTSLQIRLVEADVHDWTLIDSFEDTLDSLGLTYSSEDLNVPSEHVCESLYTIRFLGGNTNA